MKIPSEMTGFFYELYINLHIKYIIKFVYTYKNANKTCQSIDKFTWLCYNTIDNKTCQ